MKNIDGKILTQNTEHGVIKEEIFMEKIIVKIQNLLDLANNNPNENEAVAAALKAQELMAKYNVHVESVHEMQEEIDEAIFNNMEHAGNRRWRRYLANIIAKNFRCKIYLSGECIVFYGYKNDTQIALKVFTMLVSVATKLAQKEYYNHRKKYGNAKGIMNAFLIGFCEGVKEALDRQCTALMIVTPQEVEDKFSSMTSGWRKTPNTIRHSTNQEVKQRGVSAGRRAMESRKLAMT